MAEVCSQCGSDDLSELVRASDIEWCCDSCLPSFIAFAAAAADAADAAAAQQSAAAAASSHVAAFLQQSRPPPGPRTAAVCVSCKVSLGPSSYSSSQWKRASKGATCAPCVEKALAEKSVPLFSIGAISFQLEDLLRDSGARLYVVENGGDPGSPSCPKQVARSAAYGALLADVFSCRNSTSRDAWFVGVDCEGTAGDIWAQAPGKAGACLAQVSSRRVVVVEVLTTARSRRGGGASKELRGLLEHPDVVKVFCDARGDINALVAEMAKEGVEPAPVVAPVRDLQKMVPGKSVSSLTQIISSACQLPVEKQSIKKNKWWALNTAHKMAMAPGFINYAAADAWGTWLAYEYITAREYGEISVEEVEKGERDAEALRALYSKLVETLRS